MAHLHPVYDTDSHFIIDPESRDIIYDGTDPLILIQNDHNSEHYTFEMPRYIDGHDMMLCNLVQVHYINIDAENGSRNPGVYEVTDLQLATDDENVVVCSWAISQNGTQLVGSLVFALRFACMTGDTIDYAWNTIAYSGVAISSGIYNAEAVATKYADVLETWYQEFITTGETSVTNINGLRELTIKEINDLRDSSIDEIKSAAEEFTPEITQETGNNEGKVMSQKATTNFVKGYVPKVATRNLLNLKFDGGWIDHNTGKYSATDRWSTTSPDYIAVEGGENYTFSWKQNDPAAFSAKIIVFEYSADYVFIKVNASPVYTQAAQKDCWFTLTLDTNCAFVRISIERSSGTTPMSKLFLENFQMEKGDAATEYVSPSYIDNSQIDLLGHPDADKFAKVENIPTENEIEEIAQEVSAGYINKVTTRNLLNVTFQKATIDNTGKFIDRNDGFVSSPDYISVTGGENYTFSWEKDYPYEVYIDVFEYKADKTFIKKSGTPSLSSSIIHKTITLDAECAFVRLMLVKGSSATGVRMWDIMPDKLQLEEGDTATDYVPPTVIDNSQIDLLGHPDASKFVRAEDALDEAEIQVISQGVVTDYIPKATTRNLLNVDDLQPALIGPDDGKITIGSHGFVSTVDGIPVTGGQTYTVSWVGGDGKEGYLYVFMYKSDKTYIGYHAKSVDAPDKYLPCAIDTECAFVRFMISTGALARIDNLQFEEGEATDYVPPTVIDNSQIDLLGHPDADKFARVDNMTTIDPTAYGLPVLEFNGNMGGISKENAVTLSYKYGEREGTCTLKWQGSSSLTWPKKNYTVKFDSAFEAKEGWGEQKKYCLKANYIDFSHARNICSAKLWGGVVKSRMPKNETLNALPNGGAIDGFPICVMINGKYQGLYTFNIPKDGWLFGMGEGATEAVVCADRSDRASCAFKGLAELTDDFEVEYAPDEDDTEWIKTSLNRLLQGCIDCSSEEDFDTNVAPYLDVESAIDYFIHILVLSHYDGVVKNYILVTYDGTKWFFSAYDMDTTFGLNWDGTKIYNINRSYVNNFDYMSGYNRMFELLRTYKADKLKARYTEIVNGALNMEKVTETVTDFIGSIPKALYDEEVKIWTGIPSTSVNNLSQITDFYRRRREYIDAQIEAL